MFYTFRQNNSGGRFTKTASVDVFVIVEAATAAEANGTAVSLGIYFDGVRQEVDCDCCGDRWSAVDDQEGAGRPTIYGDALTDDDINRPDGEIIIHYADGSVLRSGGVWGMREGFEGQPVLEHRHRHISTQGALWRVSKSVWERLMEEDDAASQ